MLSSELKGYLLAEREILTSLVSPLNHRLTNDEKLKAKGQLEMIKKILIKSVGY